jgi:hypothetical protein
MRELFGGLSAQFTQKNFMDIGLLNDSNFSMRLNRSEAILYTWFSGILLVLH